MRKTFATLLAYIGAGLTLAIAVCTPFVLISFFSKTVAHARLRIDSIYTGGTIAQTIARNGYSILVYQPVSPYLLQRSEPFIQLAWSPINALPSQISDEIDLDQDGRPDIHITFTIPSDSQTPLKVDVVSLNNKYQSLMGIRDESFSRLIVRANGAILVRIPLKQKQAALRK